MSKIEKALRKAREGGRSPGKGLVRAQQDAERPTNLTTENAVAMRSSSELVGGNPDSAATIAFMSQPTALDSKGRLQNKIIYPEASENATTKALREIRTKVLQKTSGRNCVIMVTGTSLGSGTSFIAANLAAAFALDSARTSLAIDCNIHDPYLHRLVAGDIKAGLTNYLSNSRGDIADIILPTGIPRMRVIPAGVDVDPTVEYFTMDRMRRLIRSISDRYPDRNIFLDSPPIARSADAQILVEFCDYVVLAVPYAKATPFRLQSALKLIDSRKLLGVILNDEPSLPAIDWKSSMTSVLSDAYSRIVEQVGAWKQVGRRTGKKAGKKSS